MIISAPFSGFEETAGCKAAPARIIEFMKSFSLNENGYKPALDFAAAKTAEELQALVSGSLQYKEALQSASGAHAKSRAVIIGGDHTITLNCFREFSKKFPNPGIIVFDAHPDCSKKLNSSQEDLLVRILRENLTVPDRILVVGMSTWYGEEKEFLEVSGIRYHTMKRLLMEGIENVCDSTMETCRQWPAVYISVDMDVLDQAFAPAVSSPEPGGMSSRELIYFLQRMCLLKNVMMADVCEADAAKDLQHGEATLKAAAKIAYELL